MEQRTSFRIRAMKAGQAPPPATRKSGRLATAGQAPPPTRKSGRLATAGQDPPNVEVAQEDPHLEEGLAAQEDPHLREGLIGLPAFIRIRGRRIARRGRGRGRGPQGPPGPLAPPGPQEEDPAPPQDQGPSLSEVGDLSPIPSPRKDLNYGGSSSFSTLPEIEHAVAAGDDVEVDGPSVDEEKEVDGPAAAEVDEHEVDELLQHFQEGSDKILSMRKDLDEEIAKQQVLADKIAAKPHKVLIDDGDGDRRLNGEVDYGDRVTETMKPCHGINQSHEKGF